ncbi:TonB system transport protein ExbD [Arcobacter sp. CECT 8985]|uniref:TonB system transport protein ExbD n=1 Tax=Arcobacter sp. CECT 8985 TaxID=1935424 RepID=UPI00100ACA10|nr:TonB system transport protein ExbD [Arcobacter sp. CECT 8985]RXJ86704.1 TonB system transport protein ExbD [Arcobacter sp. CECT 8985]
MKIKKFDSINVIPFIDVLLVLLAIILMTSTFITKGIIPVNLPHASNANSINTHKQVNIIVKKSNQIYFKKQRVSIKTLKIELLKLNRKTPINIKSDKQATFDTFVQILDALKSNNFENISILTKK